MFHRLGNAARPADRPVQPGQLQHPQHWAGAGHQAQRHTKSVSPLSGLSQKGRPTRSEKGHAGQIEHHAAAPRRHLLLEVLMEQSEGRQIDLTGHLEHPHPVPARGGNSHPQQPTSRRVLSRHAGRHGLLLGEQLVHCRRCWHPTMLASPDSPDQEYSRPRASRNLAQNKIRNKRYPTERPPASAIRGEAAGSQPLTRSYPAPPGVEQRREHRRDRPGWSDKLRTPDSGYPLMSTHTQRQTLNRGVARCPPDSVPQEGYAIDGRRMDLTSAATPHEARELRVRFERWLRENGAPVTDAEDLGLAVYEALANAAEHAYGPDQPGRTMRLLARLDRDHVTVSVIDQGRWRPSGESRYRGRGLALMRHLTTDVHIEPSTHGTTVHLRTHLRAKEGSARAH